MRNKITAALAAVVILGMNLTGCGKLGQTYSDYVKSVMDCCYHNDSAKYIELTYSTESDAEIIYTNQVEWLAEGICSYYEVNTDYVSEECMEGYEALAEELLARTRYTVHPAEYSNGSFQVTIDIQPLDFWEITQEEMQNYCDTIYNVEKKLVHTDPELAVLETAYAEDALVILQGYVSETGYKETVTKTVTIVEDADGSYGLADQDWLTIDDLVLGLE